MNKFPTASKIKVGVIGYGGAFNMGKAHLSECVTAGMAPYAVAEIDPARLEVAQRDFPGIKTYSTAKKLLADPDVDLVVLITPHNTHAPLALQCIAAGKHVVCEKPFAITTAECDAMIAAGKKKKVMVSTYHNRHWDGCVLHALKTIKSGVIGEPYRIEAHMGNWGKPGDWWRSSKTISGGLLYDWGVHLIEYSLQILTGHITEVMGVAKSGYWASQTKWKKDTVEDEGFLVVRFDDERWLTMSMTSLDTKGKDGQMEITGTKGTLTFDYWNWKLMTRDENNNSVVVSGPHPKSEGWRFYKNVADHLVKGTALVITPEWARRPIHIIDSAYQSIKKGAAVKTKYQ